MMSITGGQRPTAVAGAYGEAIGGAAEAPQRGADGSPSTGNAWQHPLRPTPPLVRPSPPSQEELRKWIQTEVARTCGGMAHLLTCT